jgi:hypothetical protein
MIERALRAASLLLLAALLLRALRNDTRVERPLTSDGSDLAANLPRWSSEANSRAIHVILDTAPGDTALAWLAALRRAGSDVSWSGSVPRLAISVERLNDPAGGAQISVAADSGSTVVIGDAAGPVDSVRVTGAGALLRVPILAGPAWARIGKQQARAAPPDEPVPGRVLVLGAAGWESRFVIRALEESGWRVEARLRVGPQALVKQGPATPPDTARYAVVVVLDSTAADLAQAIVRFARQGGGVILAGRSAEPGALREIAAGGVGSRVAAQNASFSQDEPRKALAFWPVESLRKGAVPIERRGGGIAAAARRLTTGRVIQVGYDESWRWRMQGGERGIAAHRAWWSALVGGAAMRRAEPVESSDGAAAAPLAHLVARLGEPREPPESQSRGPVGPMLDAWLAAALALSLLVEWASRRFRGAP